MSGTEENETVIDMAELGVPDLPRNSGKRRTPSKRALLAAIELSGGQW
jgi:hypothetical protein